MDSLKKSTSGTALNKSSGSLKKSTSGNALSSSSSKVDVVVHDYIAAQPGEVKHTVKTSSGELACYLRMGENSEHVELPFIVTYHDLGTNHVSCFSPFFGQPAMKTVLPFINILHIEAPGHEYNSADIENHYPSLEQMSQDILYVLDHFKIKTFIGLGSGAGSAVLTKFAINNPKYVIGLILVGSALKSFGWLETVKHWIGFKSIPSFKNPENVKNYLIKHFHLGELDTTSPDIMQSIINEMNMINTVNMCHYVESYLKKDDINLNDIHGLKCKILVVVGKDDVHVDDVIELFSHFNPSLSTLITIPECGALVTVEKPYDLIEPFKLYMQGLGFLLDYYQSIGDEE
ncbi:NDR family protein [Heterostelium album PN500]|uniref:NDR family protein n=1 Tax=Heterostelium pallidum (strain ATCC 26659 / Pp 5 / PN500) TaxID=670386 RepID=D3BFF1_HETP5|nr:NDR family protein [Heterostelium album PN500]EFA79865.1 NDR family protein [Heterostelium album PN500]|eukprot:XP_020431986.1 NDR family protein [Heterostelium album PN500]